MSISNSLARQVKNCARTHFGGSFAAMTLASTMILSPVSATALVLYDEAVQGDIANNTVEILTAGEYTISATTTRGFQGGPTDFDTLLISLAPELEFTAGSVEITGIINQTGGTASPSISLSSPTPTGTAFHQNFQFREDSLQFVSSTLPASADLFTVNASGGCGGSVRCSGSYSYDWTYSLTASEVSTVPVGAPLWMLLTACLGLVGLRSRRSA